jgi:hypothetical protein
MRCSDSTKIERREERIARNRSRASPTTIQDTLWQTVNYGRGVVSTRTFFTERIQQGDIENTRVLEIVCQDEKLGNVTSVYWVLVNDKDTMGEIGVQWANILWNEDISIVSIIGSFLYSCLMEGLFNGGSRFELSHRIRF